MSRFPHCIDNLLTDGGKFAGLTYRPCSTLRKIYCYSLLSDAKETQGLVRLEGLGKFKKIRSLHQVKNQPPSG
jgi:hypothetical protein